MMEKYDFPDMLGPPEEWPEGSPAWAMRVGARLRYNAENMERNAITPMIRTLRLAMEARPRPWSVWPEGAPCGSVDAFIELALGMSVERVLAVVEGYHQDCELGRLIREAKS
jgi:hypothetical protein